MTHSYSQVLKSALLCCLLLVSAAFAWSQTQHAITGLVQKDIQMPGLHQDNRTDGVVDTIFDYFNRSSTFYLLEAGTGGYTIGTNTFTEEVGVHYTALPGVTKVTEVMVFFAHKEIMLGAADSLTIRAYACGADSMPTTILGEGKVSVADCDTSNSATFIPLSILDSTSGDIFVSVNYHDNVNDTVAITANNVLTTNGGPDGNLEKRTRQYLSTDEWFRVYDIWNFGGAPMDADAMILPIVDYTEIVGIDPGMAARDLTLYPPYPNPATSSVGIRFALQHPQRVAITVYDAQGRPVLEADAAPRPAGDQTVDLDLQSLPAGAYYYTVQAERGVLAGKFLHFD